jgi:hypothetical protein
MSCDWFVRLSDGTEMQLCLPPDVALARIMVEVAFYPLQVRVIVNMDALSCL